MTVFAHIRRGYWLDVLDIRNDKKHYGHFTSSVLARLVHCEMIHGRSSRSKFVDALCSACVFCYTFALGGLPQLTYNRILFFDAIFLASARLSPRQSPLRALMIFEVNNWRRVMMKLTSSERNFLACRLPSRSRSLMKRV